jgi:hypothetical protein
MGARPIVAQLSGVGNIIPEIVIGPVFRFQCVMHEKLSSPA